MKQPFRYFRSELNGFYLKALVTCPNFFVKETLDEIAYQTAFQWKLEDEVGADEVPIREADIFNLAKIAGLSLLQVIGESPLGSIVFTHSYVVDAAERSERGFMYMPDEYVKYLRTHADEYLSDIVEEATNNLRMGHIPENSKPIGYVLFGTDLFTSDGKVIWENLLTSPPEDSTPYTEYYGEKFLIFEEKFLRNAFITTDLFKLLFECLQWIRYNGATIATFMEVTRIIGDGYIKDIDISFNGRYYTVNYRLDLMRDTYNKQGRLGTWQYICDQKFKLFTLNEVDG